MNLKVEISLGELVDKLTILEIKLDEIKDAAKRGNVAREYGVLESALPAPIKSSPEVAALRAKLREVNAELWRIEDDIRDCERAKNFGENFVALARAVYHTNDRRAALKRELNLMHGGLVEEKSYQPY